MDKLKLGIVGCGDVAGYAALFARLNQGLHLAACCDIARERTEAFARRYGIGQIYTDYGEMLEKANLEAVYLAVPHNLHAPMIKAAVAKGLHVFTEKPVTRTLAEGKEIAWLVEQAPVKVAVNYQYRYDNSCYALWSAMQSGQLGEVRYIRINIPWHREPAYFEQSAWHKTLAAAGGGTLITQGSHFIDLALWLCGQPARSVMGRTAQRVFQNVEVEDLAMAIIELENGTLIDICSSMAAAVEQTARVEVYGSTATGIYTARPVPRTSFLGRRVQTERLAVRGPHALARSLEGFRRWVRGGAPHLVPVKEALPALAVVEAIYRSASSLRQEAVEGDCAN